MEQKLDVNIKAKPITPFPSLSHWTTTLESKLDEVLTTYICTNYQQSTMFSGKLYSLPYTLGRFAQDPEHFALTVEEELGKLLASYFKIAEVRATAKSIPNLEHFVEVFLEISISDLDGSSYNQSSRILTEDSKIRRITHFTNTGEIKYERDISRRTIYR